MSVFDASALLAVAYAETGSDVASRRLATGVISTVNVAEAAGRMVQKGARAEAAVAELRNLGLRWIAPGADLIARVAELRAIKDLSLGDRFCIALAEQRGEPIVTADQDWRDLPIRVPLELIR